MKFSATGYVRRLGRAMKMTAAGPGACDSPGAGLEPLEARVLLSGATQGDLPDLSNGAVFGNYTYQVDVPEQGDATNYQQAYGHDPFGRPNVGDWGLGVSDTGRLVRDFRDSFTPLNQNDVQVLPYINSVVIGGGHLKAGSPTRITAHGVNRGFFFGLNPDKSGAIDRVMFFYDADGDRRMDDFLGEDTVGDDGVYSILTELGADYALSTDGRVVAVVMDTDGNYGARDVLAEERLSVEIGAGKGLVYHEADGSEVTVTLAGGGTASVLLQGTGVRAHDLGGVVEIKGDAVLEDINLEETTGRSKLVIDVSGGRGKASRATMLGDVTGSTPLGLLYAPRVDFLGGVTMSGRGVIRSLKVRSIGYIGMPGDGFVKGVKISAGRINGRIKIGSHLRLLNAGTVPRMYLTAPSAERILIRGNYLSGWVSLEDSDAKESLGLMVVGGRMNDVQVHAAASIDTIRVSQMSRSRVVAGAWTHNLIADEPTLGLVRQGTIQKLRVGRFINSKVTTWRLGRVRLDEVRDWIGEGGGLSYHRLGVYRGPSVSTPTFIQALTSDQLDF